MSHDGMVLVVLIWGVGVIVACGDGWRFAAGVVWPAIVLRQAVWAIITGSHESEEDSPAAPPESASSSADNPNVGIGNPK